MKTEKTNPQSTTRNEDTNQSKPSVTTGTTHFNPDAPKTPQKEEKETWKHPDPTAPEKKQEVYAGDKRDRTDKRQEEDITDEEDVDTNPRAENINRRNQEEDNIDRGANYNDQIRP